MSAVLPTLWLWSNVIVNYLILLWQFLITPPVLWGLAIQHCNNTSSVCQSLYIFPGVWLSFRTGLVTMFTCGPSIFFRLIPYKPEWPVFCSLQLCYIPLARDRLLALYWQCNSMIQTKPLVFLLSLFFLNLGSIYCAAEVASTKARICKLLFYTFCFLKKKKKTSNGGYIKQRTRPLWSHSECNEVTLH